MSVIWVVAVTNIYNFMDGIDGIAAGDEVGAYAAQNRTIGLTLALAAPFFVAFLVMPELIMSALFQRGAFDAEAAARAGAVLAAYGLGLPAAVLIRSAVSSFYARSDTATPLIASLTAVGVNILYTGYGLLRRSVTGLLDASIPAEELERVERVLAGFRAREPVDFHALRSRESGRQRFVYVHLLVPAQWTVLRGHDLANEVSESIDDALPGAHTFVHIEPLDDPSSYDHDYLPQPPAEAD